MAINGTIGKALADKIRESRGVDITEEQVRNALAKAHSEKFAKGMAEYVLADFGEGASNDDILQMTGIRGTDILSLAEGAFNNGLMGSLYNGLPEPLQERIFNEVCDVIMMGYMAGFYVGGSDHDA